MNIVFRSLANIFSDEDIYMVAEQEQKPKCQDIITRNGLKLFGQLVPWWQVLAAVLIVVVGAAWYTGRLRTILPATIISTGSIPMISTITPVEQTVVRALSGGGLGGIGNFSDYFN